MFPAGNAPELHRKTLLKHAVVYPRVSHVCGIFQLLQREIRCIYHRQSCAVAAVHDVVDLLQSVIRGALRAQVVEDKQVYRRQAAAKVAYTVFDELDKRGHNDRHSLRQ